MSNDDRKKYIIEMVNHINDSSILRRIYLIILVIYRNQG